jgi:hypothetical protein
LFAGNDDACQCTGSVSINSLVNDLVGEPVVAADVINVTIASHNHVIDLGGGGYAGTAEILV